MSLPLRIAYVVAYPQRLAGANRSLLELVQHLPADIAPTVICLGEGAVADAYRQIGVPVEVVEVRGALGQFGKALLQTSAGQQLRMVGQELLPLTFALRRRFRAIGTDLVHVNDSRGALLAVPAARLAGLPVVVHLRGEFPFGTAGRLLFELAPDSIIAVSDGVRDSLSRFGRRKTVTIYNGIRPEPPPRTPIPWLAGLRSRGVCVGVCMASVVPFKGQHHLIRAVARLNAAGLRDRFTVFCVGELVPGYGDYQDWLATLRGELGCDNITFAGWSEDPFRFYASADLSVLPSVSSERLTLPAGTIDVRGNEGFPRTHLEAMVYGLPIVGTRIAGVAEQVEDGVTGLLVPAGDPERLAGALERLALDPALRARMGEAGRARVLARFSTTAYVEAVCREYRRLT